MRERLHPFCLAQSKETKRLGHSPSLRRLPSRKSPPTFQRQEHVRDPLLHANDRMTPAIKSSLLAYDAIKALAGDSPIIPTSLGVAPLFYAISRQDWQPDRPRADEVKGGKARGRNSVRVDNVKSCRKPHAGRLAPGPENAPRPITFQQATTRLNQAAVENAAKHATLRAQDSAAASNATLRHLMLLQAKNGPCPGKWSNRYEQAGGRQDRSQRGHDHASRH